jgi:hypothetical protein
VFPIRRLLEHLGWQMALLTTSGICMLNCVFGLMFVPLPAQQVIYDLILVLLYAQLCLQPHVCPLPMLSR